MLWCFLEQGRPVAQFRAPMKTAAPADEDSDRDDSYSPVSGRVSIGQAGGRSIRGNSPMVNDPYFK